MEICIDRLIENLDEDVLLHYYNSLKENENEKKLVVDRLLKRIFQRLMMEENNAKRFTSFLDLIVFCVQKDVCKSPTLFSILSDMFDVSTLDQSDAIFAHLEQHILVWKSEAFYAAGKNYLLRTCNDLLKRLSRSQNTIFSGRIQLFLAHLFSIDEKSGLNLMSHFNVENITSHTSVPSLPPHNQEEMVDFKLYTCFWSLQDFFRLPSQCYDKALWGTFVQSTEDVLACFSSFKLDSSRPSINCDQHTFFPKFLTNQKLLNLQLNDSNFRRYILLQHLIVFQYLLSAVKFKQAHQVLTEDQLVWIKLTSEKVYKLISETPPNGDNFLNVVKHVLSREENWNGWKNEGCVSFTRKEDEAVVSVNRRKKRSLGEDMRSNSKVVKMGNPELTRLWNLCSDNHKACMNPDRNFQREPATFLEDAISQLNPANEIEEAHKSVNDAVFSWKAMRMLARFSPSFFHANQSKDVKTVPQYLESVLMRVDGGMVRSAPVETQQRSTEQTSAQASTESVEDLLDGVEEGWRRFGEVVGMPGCELDELEERQFTSRQACLEVLQWWKASCADITADKMKDVLLTLSQS